MKLQPLIRFDYLHHINFTFLKNSSSSIFELYGVRTKFVILPLFFFSLLFLSFASSSFSSFLHSFVLFLHSERFNNFSLSLSLSLFSIFSFDCLMRLEKIGKMVCFQAKTNLALSTAENCSNIFCALVFLGFVSHFGFGLQIYFTPGHQAVIQPNINIR